MTAHHPTPLDPDALLLRNALHWARSISTAFDEACIAQPNLRLHRVLHAGTYRYEGAENGITLRIGIVAGHIEMLQIHPPHTVTLRRPLPARLTRESKP